MTMTGAAIRYRPNGVYVRCASCNAFLDYRNPVDNGKSILYRCRSKEHPSGAMKYQTVPLLQSEDKRKVIGGLNDRCRIMCVNFFSFKPHLDSHIIKELIYPLFDCVH